MCFRKSCLREIWLDKCPKTLFQRSIRKTTRQMGRQSLAIWWTTPLQKLLNTVEVEALEAVSLSDTQNPNTVC